MDSRKFSAPKDCVRVLVRSFDDRPTSVFGVNTEGAYVQLTQEDGSLLIGFPRALVYNFQDELYQKLRAVAETGQNDQLVSLWAMASRLDAEVRQSY